MKNIIYLDNNATTALDPEVLAEMLPVFAEHYGNPASKTHAYGWYAEELVNLARERVAALINAQPEEIIFTSGATESINLAIKGLAENQTAKSKVISAKSEHRASLDTFEHLEKKGFVTHYLPLTSKGEINLDDLSAALDQQTFLVSLMLANNEIGTLHKISELVKLCKDRGVVFHCDATQALGKIKVDVKELAVDLLSISAHKIYCPKGIGALYIRQKSSAARLQAQIHGGGHENGFRSGTLNVPAIVGFGKACEIANNRLAIDANHLKNLSELFYRNLSAKIPDISLNGPELKERLPGNLNLKIAGIDNKKLLAKTNAKIAYSLSSACTSAQKKPSHVLSAIGLNKEEQEESIRIGIGRFNTEDEIVKAVEILASAIDQIRT